MLAAKVTEPQFAGLDDHEVAALLNAPDPALAPVWQPVPVEAARAVLLSRFEWAALKAARQHANAQIAGVADAMVDAMTLQSSIDLSNDTYRAAVTQGMSALVAAGVLTQAAADALLALGRRYRSWAEVNDLYVDAAAVAAARGKPMFVVQDPADLDQGGV